MYILHHKTCGALQKGQPNDDLASAGSVSWSSRGDRVSSSTRMSLSLNFCSDSKSSAFNNGMLSVATTTITYTSTTTTTTTTTTSTTTTKPLQPLLLIIFSWPKDSLARPYLKVLVCIYANARYYHLCTTK